MKRKLIHALALALGLLCATAACAETMEEVRARLGSCSLEDYAGKTFATFDYEEPAPFRASEQTDAESGLTVWSVAWGPDDREYLDNWRAYWFPSRGTVADALYDLDADGALEWIVLVTRDGSDEVRSVENGAFLWLCVYELEDGDARLADECCLSASWDCFSSFTRASLTAAADGTPVLLAQDTFGVDTAYTTFAELSYDGSALTIHGLLSYQPWEVGGAFLRLGSGSSTDAIVRARELVCREDLLDGAILPYFEDEGEPIPVKLLDFESSDEYDWEQRDERRELLERYVKAMGLKMDIDGNLTSGTFQYEAFPADGIELLLLRASEYNPDDGGHPYLRIERALNAQPKSAVATGDCNLRAGSGLDAAGVGVIPKGARAEYLGEQSVDRRGVAWYRVRYGALEGWASSKYIRLC